MSFTRILRRQDVGANEHGIEPASTCDLAPTGRRRSTVALVLVATFAVALRSRMMVLGRSLWLDEAALALNICGRSFEGLLRPLDHDQAAPIGFLFIERAAVVAFGPNETALCLFPFLASLASLALIWRFNEANFDRWTAVVAVALAGVMPGLFYYAGELKQYSSDVASGLVILVLASGALRRGLTGPRAAWLAVAGMILIWISHPSVFVLAGVGTTLILAEAMQRRFRVAATAVAVSACWLASFALEYVLFLRGLQANEFLTGFWDSAFLPFPPMSPRDLRIYPAVAFGLFEALFLNAHSDFDLSMRMGVFLAATWLIGLIVLVRQKRRNLSILLVMPLVFAVLASMAHKYPLKGRLALFTAAMTLPVIAAGIAGLSTASDAATRRIGLVLLACALLLPTMQGAQFLVERPRMHDARAVLTHVARHWNPGDIVVVDRYSALPFEYYQTYGKIAGLGEVVPVRSDFRLSEPEELVREIERWKGQPRVWFLLDTALPDPVDLSRGALKVVLDQEGDPLDSISRRRYSAHLYGFDKQRRRRHQPS